MIIFRIFHRCANGDTSRMKSNSHHRSNKIAALENGLANHQTASGSREVKRSISQEHDKRSVSAVSLRSTKSAGNTPHIMRR